jgi:hypothetical protein
MMVPPRPAGRTLVAALLLAAGTGCGRSCPSGLIPRCPPDSAGLAPTPITPGVGQPRRPSRFNLLDTGATGPGVDNRACRPFLNGALDPATGWPQVFLDHYAPRPDRVANLRFVQARGAPGFRYFRFDGRGQLVEEGPRVSSRPRSPDAPCSCRSSAT